MYPRGDWRRNRLRIVPWPRLLENTDSRYPEQFEMDQENLPCRHFEVFIMKYLVSA
jgi:hypothetical protein